MGTNVEYNGVTLENCLTLEFDQTPQRDDSRTDKIFDRFVITVRSCMSVSILAARFHGVHGRGIAGGELADVVASMQNALSHDRKPFRYTMEGHEVVTCETGLNDRDQDNGPKVRQIRIVQHTPQTVQITFSVEFTRNLCTNAPSPVINNRWSSVDDVDDLWRVTRSWRGKLRLSGTVNLPRNPQDFRTFAFPPLQGGFRRTRMHFLASPDMLELAYEITDQQMLGEAAPSPALKMSATHTESFVNDGSKSVGEFMIRLDGERGADKGKMIERAMQVAVAKLAIKGSPDTHLVRNLMIVDHIGEDVNAVEVRAVVERAATENQLAANGASAIGVVGLSTIGKPLAALKLANYDANKARMPGEYGTATLVGLFACFLQTPCGDENHSMPEAAAAAPAGDPTPYGTEKDGASATYSIGKVDDGFLFPKVTDDHAKKAMWSYAAVSSHYHDQQHRLGLPIGLPATQAAGNVKKPTAAIVRLAPETCRRTVFVKVERVGAWPTAFNKEDFKDHNEIDHWLVDHKQDIAAAKYAADGRVIFSADFTYVYALSRCPDAYESRAVGFLPWDRRSGRDNDLPATSLLPPTSSKGLT